MKKLQTLVDDNTAENLKEMSKQQGKPLSKIIAELIDIGYKFKQVQSKKSNKEIKEEEKKAELIAKQPEYLLRIITLISDMYRCVRNEKSNYKEKEIDDVLYVIKDKARTYINGYIEKN